MRNPKLLRPVSRPAAPSCRGGASSLLRLSQPAASASLQRAAAALAPWPRDEGASIITRLAPSHELAIR